MKIIAILMLLLAGLSAHADCQDEWLTYQSSTQYLFVEYSEGCYAGDLILHFAKFSENGPKWPDPSVKLISIPFNQECSLGEKNKDGETVQFSCRKDGISPLAGGTYRFKLIKTTIECGGVVEPDWDHTFICIKDCGPTTPKKLIVPFGEGCA